MLQVAFIWKRGWSFGKALFLVVSIPVHVTYLMLTCDFTFQESILWVIHPSFRHDQYVCFIPVAVVHQQYGAISYVSQLTAISSKIKLYLSGTEKLIVLTVVRMIQRMLLLCDLSSEGHIKHKLPEFTLVGTRIVSAGIQYLHGLRSSLSIHHLHEFLLIREFGIQGGCCYNQCR